MSNYAKIIVDIANSEVDRVFDYSVPEDMELLAGHHVRVPFGNREIEGFVTDIVSETEVPENKIKPVRAIVEREPVLTMDQLELADWMREKYNCTLAEAFRQMLPAELRGQRVREKTALVARKIKDGYPEKCTALQKALLDELAEGERAIKDINSSVARALEKKGFVQITGERVARRPFIPAAPGREIEPEPTIEQADAIDAICDSLEGRGGRFLLYGVTGSGKTEVYIRAVKRALSLGRGAIVLVPEIALTPQTVGWFQSRLGGAAAVMHSRLSAGERYDEWQRALTGEARVVIGARSAVFTPVKNLGLIIVDEEHEHTYRSEKRPRYDAREIAWHRCEAGNGVLVLGSATPEIATYMRAQPGVKPENRLRLLSLPHRATGRPLPEVRIVDMRRELAHGNTSIFSSALQRAMADALSNKAQIMLFINRRGYSSFVSCRSCGHVERCEACDIAMTYHITDGTLKCHYCGRIKSPPKICPECGSKFIKFFGAGTQKVAEEASKLFPEARILRADADTTSGKDAHARLFDSFARGEADILVGTQMIAKGLDFPNVTLVGVVAADASINVPDYRAGERTFQLIAQVSGRAGRSERPGLVILQSYEPDNPIIGLSAKQDFRAFYESEKLYRRRALYPPYTVISRLVVAGEDKETASLAAEALCERLGAFIEAQGLSGEVLNLHWKEAPIAKLNGLYRFHVFLKLYSRGRSAEALRKLDELSRETIEGVSVEAEINPVNMM